MIPVMPVTSPRRPRAARSLLALVAAAVLAGCGSFAPPGSSGTPAASPDRSTNYTASPVATTSPSDAPASSLPRPEPSASSTVAPVRLPSGPPSLPTVALQASIDRWLRATGAPGISVTVRWADGRTWTGSAGYADVGRRTPVTENTAFAIASLTKTFTSAVIMRLVEEGRVGLEDSVARYLPEQHLDKRITVRMLLDHTSGLFDVFLAPGIDRALQSAPSTAWTVSRALAYRRKAYFAPGTRWHYSNTNYMLLGLIAERVTQDTLAAEVRRRFLTPLGLAGTWTQAVEPPRDPLAHGYALTGTRATPRQRDLSDGTRVVPFTSIITAIDGAGAVASTSRDLATWATDLYGGHVLSGATLDTMVADQQRTVAYIPGVRYGLGVQVYSVGPWTTLGHSGLLLGFRGQMRYVPALGLSIAALTNQSRTDLMPLMGQLLEIILPRTGTPRSRLR
jgi:D-alanyl-D-alanine carboxypeptidase